MPSTLIGSTVNAGGTKVASAKAMGTGVLDTSNKANDASTLVTVGAHSIPVSKAINMGLLQRNTSGVLEELNPAQPYTRVG